LKDQAYQQDSKGYGSSKEEYEQLKAWQEQKRERDSKRILYIWGSLGLALLVLVGLMLLFF